MDVLRTRTKQFAIDAIALCERLPRSRTADVIGRQLLRSATSVGANYRAACHARSRAEFVAKLGIVEEEADESAFWMELLLDCHLAGREPTDALRDEACQIVAMVAASIRTARAPKRVPDR